MNLIIRNLVSISPLTDDIIIAPASVRQICHLYDSEQLQRVLTQIEETNLKPRKAEDILGPVEADPEYQLIVEANSLAVDIDNEINTIHKFTKDKYNKRFPELESLVPSPLEYLRTCKELGNDLDKAKNNPILPTFLTQATIMVVSVTASTTHGLVIPILITEASVWDG